MGANFGLLSQYKHFHYSFRQLIMLFLFRTRIGIILCIISFGPTKSLIKSLVSYITLFHLLFQCLPSFHVLFSFGSGAKEDQNKLRRPPSLSIIRQSIISRDHNKNDLITSLSSTRQLNITWLMSLNTFQSQNED